MKKQGRIWVFKDNDINTDLIFPGKYTYEPLNPEEQAKHAMENYALEFAKQVKQHDIIVAGKNFGCGSSREQAVTCLKHAGVDAIVAQSFARLFYRNAINSALAVIECPEAVEAVFQKETGEGPRLSSLTMAVDLSAGEILFLSQKHRFPPWEKQAMLIFEAGGLSKYTRQRLK